MSSFSALLQSLSPEERKKKRNSEPPTECGLKKGAIRWSLDGVSKIAAVVVFFHHADLEQSSMCRTNLWCTPPLCHHHSKCYHSFHFVSLVSIKLHLQTILLNWLAKFVACIFLFAIINRFPLKNPLYSFHFGFFFFCQISDPLVINCCNSKMVLMYQCHLIGYIQSSRLSHNPFWLFGGDGLLPKFVHSTCIWCPCDYHHILLLCYPICTRILPFNIDKSPS